MLSRLSIPIVALLLLVSAGCGPAALEQKLVGRWVGGPDSAEQRESRTPSVLSQHAPGADVNTLGPTDLQAFEFQIVLEFAPEGRLKMMLADGKQPLSGSWRVVSEVGERVLLELTASPDDESESVQRRFEMRLDPDGAGFTLREEGADPMFGWLYFHRSGA